MFMVRIVKYFPLSIDFFARQNLRFYFFFGKMPLNERANNITHVKVYRSAYTR